MRNRSHPALKFYFCWLSCLQRCTVCSCLNPCQGVWSFLERVAGFKQISIEPPRSSVHHVEEEGEGFCEQQKWNQEIGPKVLNFHPRSLNCPECTLLPKVIFLFFWFDTAREYRWAPVKQSSCWPVMYGQPYSVSWISVVLTHYDTLSHICSFLLMLWRNWRVGHCGGTVDWICVAFSLPSFPVQVFIYFWNSEWLIKLTIWLKMNTGTFQ